MQACCLYIGVYGESEGAKWGNGVGEEVGREIRETRWLGSGVNNILREELHDKKVNVQQGGNGIMASLGHNVLRNLDLVTLFLGINLLLFLSRSQVHCT